MAMVLKKRWIKLARLLGVAFLLVITFVAASGFYLTSDAGAKSLLNWANSHFSETDTKIRFVDLNGSIFSNFMISKIVISDAQGVWLDVNDTKVKWSAFDLLAGNISISELKVQSVIAQRLPKKPDQDFETDQATSAFELPLLPFDVGISAFDIGEIELGPELSGVKTKLTGVGALSLVAGSEVILKANIQGLGKSKDEIDVSVSYREAVSYLRADVHLNAPKGSFLTAFFGIGKDHDLSAEFAGAGSLDSWVGELSATIDATTIANARIKTAGKALNARAELDAGEFVSDSDAALFGRTAKLSFDVQPTDETGLKSFELELLADTVAVRAGGSFISSEMEEVPLINYSVDVIDTAPLNRLLAPTMLQPFTLEGSIESLGREPTVSGSVASVNLTYGNRHAASLEGKFSASVLPDSAHLEAAGSLSNIQGEYPEALEKHLEQGLDWSAVVSRNAKTGDIQFDAFSLENPAFSLDGVAEIAGETYPLSAKFMARLEDIGVFLPGTSGAAELVTSVAQLSARDPFELSTEAGFQSLSIPSTPLNELLGAEPTITLEMAREENGALNVSSFIAKGDFFQVLAGAAVTSDKMIDRSEFSIELSDLEQIDSLEGYALEGDIDFVGNLSGSALSPSIRFETRLEKLTLQSLVFQDTELEGRIDSLVDAPRGEMKISARTNAGAFVADLNISREQDGAIDLSALQVSLGQYSLTGEARGHLGNPVTGSFEFETFEAEDVKTASFGDIQGRVVLAEMSGNQRVEVLGQVTGIDFSPNDTDLLAIDAGEFSVTLLMGETVPRLSGNAVFTGVSHPRIQAEKIDAAVQGTLDEVAYSLRLSRSTIAPYDLTLSGDLARRPSGLALDLGIEGEVGGTLIRSEGPLKFSRSEAEFGLQPFALEMGSGRLTGSMSSSSGEVYLDFEAVDADLAPVNQFYPELPLLGTLNGEIRLNTTDSQQDGMLDIAVSGIRLEGGAYGLNQGFSISVAGNLQDKRVSLSGRAEFADKLDIDYTGSLPFHIDAASGDYFFPKQQPLNGQMSLQGDLATVWPLFDIPEHDLGGYAEATITLNGTPDKPTLHGDLNLRQGRYENSQTGFVASDIDFAAVIADERLVIERLTATDGNTGKVRADGFAELQDDFSLNMEASLFLDEAQLVRKPNLDVTASSRLTFTKYGPDARLVGDVTIDSANVGAFAEPKSQVLELDVTEINGEHQEMTPSSGSEPNSSTQLELDVEFEAPGKLFIRSYGLDSEWSSNLKVSGSSSDPVIAGNASLVRGTFDFSGKRFQLNRGELTFQGDADPFVDVSAEHQMQELTAILEITGRASAPSLAVSSTPDLPQDEILSRIFFGTSVASLSPLEAVQLASVVHSFNNGGGQGVIGGVRRILGIDRLAIDRAAGRDYGTTITGGKYLTDNIYVEVTTAPATGETATAVEVVLSKSLSLITRRTLDHDNNLAIRWSWSY